MNTLIYQIENDMRYIIVCLIASGVCVALLIMYVTINIFNIVIAVFCFLNSHSLHQT